MVYALRIDDAGQFRDDHNRVVTLRGVNLAADSKLPQTPDVRSHMSDQFFEGDTVSFVGRPFALEDADSHLKRIRSWGFNTLRYVYTWEALEHAGPGKYDEAFIDFTIQVLLKIKAHGFFVYMDPHQDVWSRFSGGSGAPMWTLYAAGLNPHKFATTQAALVHNMWPEPESFPKMMWPTNYDRLACQVMFTLFFAGRDFAPRAILDGVNIQDYLQDHFLAAIAYFAERVYAHGELDGRTILGWETMNEPFLGLIGHADLTTYPATQKLQSYTSPTALDSMKLGSGYTLDVPTFGFGSFGSYKTGSQVVNSEGDSAWLPADYDDSRYGWQRDDGWKLGTCLWAQHGVWNPDDGTLLRPDHFTMAADGTKVGHGDGMDRYFVPYWVRFATRMRQIVPDMLLFMQPPAFDVPPHLEKLGAKFPQMVYSPHFYDGLTLIRKHWSRWWNVDVIGVLRGRYLSPMFALRFGETSIRNCLRDQLAAIRKEGVERIGPDVPCIMGELGIPYDMDDKKAYSDGDYQAQIRAMDANCFAVEDNGLHVTWWAYTAVNTHQWGDSWNGEDLSLWSLSDLRNHAGVDTPGSVRLAASKPYAYAETGADISAVAGTRASEAFIRPSPLHTVGVPQACGFDLLTATFSLVVYADEPAKEGAPTEVYVPDYHFPNGDILVEASSGRWDLDRTGQRLYWWHDDGRQSIKIVGMRGNQTPLTAPTPCETACQA
ncbi:glycoside hydrolase superfamily [Dipodascopsis tothii]|uniref:glycoside hydrolase superfamily n=1 Tax=Dipodascopsis tothii TaxID=44089 RepID=UPI0034CE2EE7